MSSTTSSESIIPSGLVITGGIPENVDIAPSAIFMVIFILLLVPAIWRVANRSSRTLILIRPFIFILVQIAGFATRIAIVKSSNPPEGLFIAEITLVSLGIVLLAEPMAAIIQKSVLLHASDNVLLGKIMRILRIVLIIGLIVNIYAASEITDADSVDTTRTLRIVGNAMILVCIVITAVSTFVLVTSYGFPKRSAAFLIWISIILLVASVYKLAQSLDHSSKAPVNSRAAFYILLGIPEVAGGISFFAVNLVTLFNLNEVPQREKEALGDDNSGGKILGIIPLPQLLSNRPTNTQHTQYVPYGQHTEQHQGVQYPAYNNV